MDESHVCSNVFLQYTCYVLPYVFTYVLYLWDSQRVLIAAADTFHLEKSL